MKKICLLFSVLMLGLTACNKDFGTIEVTYTKATAIYGDLEETRNVTLKTEAKELSNPGKIFVSDNLLLIGEEGEGIHIMDNSDPANPENMYFLNIPGNREYYVQGSIIYAESYYDMVKIDLTNVQQPILESRAELAFAEELKNDAGETLIGFDFEVVTESVNDRGDFWNALTVDDVIFYDYANSLIPRSAVPASFAGNSNSGIGSVNRVTFFNDHVYVISNSIINVFSDEGTFEKANEVFMGNQMETIYPFQDKLFIGTRNSMEVLDVSDPANPQRVSSFWHATSCDPVYPTDEVAYVTLRTGDFSNCPGDINALIVLSIQEITNPTELQEIEMLSPYGITLIDNKLYVGEGANGLKIFDATNRENLTLETYDNSIQAYDVIAHPTRPDLLLIAGPEGLGQYEIEAGSGLGLLSWMNF